MITARVIRVIGLGVCLGATSLATSACSSSTSTPPSASVTADAPSATSTAVTSSPADSAKQMAVTAYLGMWRNYADAAMTSDWQSPKLGEFATGTALSTMSRGLYADHYNGLVSRGQPVNNPVVSSVEPPADPTKVLISDCGDSTNWTRHRADNGQPAAAEPGGRRRINAVVDKQSDGSWKVSDFGVREVGSC